MRYLTADRIYPVSSAFLENAVVIVRPDGTIEEIVSRDTVDPLKTEHFAGVICPGFVNTHCHLELSHLKWQLKERTGIVGFAMELMQKRFSFSPEEIQQAMASADDEMRRNGIVAVGDISNDSSSFAVKSHSAVYYHTFIELISLNPESAGSVFEKGKKILQELPLQLSGSLAPHAPYSVSEKLMQLISDDEHAPFTIHNQESAAEDEFVRRKQGDFLKLYEWLKLPLDHFEARGVSSLQNSLQYFPKQKNILLVHNTCTPDEEISSTMDRLEHLYWCLCPNANLYIENKLPDLPALLKHNATLTIGTDSLASNHELNILSELLTLHKNFPGIGLQRLLEWSTWNGAKFLGIEKQYGSIEKGKKPGLNLISEIEQEQLSAKSTVTRLI